MARKDSGGNEPLAQERRRKILELLQEEGSARVRKLSAVFKVSEPTIRQDLEKLEEEGYIIREHGGAFLRTMPQQVGSQSLQHSDNLDRKLIIARRAATLVKPGDRIILDSGSTVTELAKCIKDIPDLTVITNALNIALIMGANPSCRLMVTGGEFKAPTLSLTGEKAALFFRNVYVDKLFLATGGISPNFELTYPGFSDLVVKQAMIDVARETTVLADSTKFGRASLASLGSLRIAARIITDSGISSQIRDTMSAMGVEVVIAS